MSNVTLKDIAKLANISPAAVSIILMINHQEYLKPKNKK